MASTDDARFTTSSSCGAPGGRVSKDAPLLMQRDPAAMVRAPWPPRKADQRPAFWRSCSRRRKRWILPVSVRGREATNSMARGYL